MTQAQLSRALGRGSSELFRALATLERRGYLRRDPVSGVYEPILRLYELGQPTRLGRVAVGGGEAAAGLHHVDRLGGGRGR
jgi:DNA-binding IclR family transcriptional regulator